MNYGERLAFWYLRLNGFSPISNFVNHRTPVAPRSASDADILAIRNPFVFEEVGGQQQDWDPRLAIWGLPIETNHVSILVEVKTGQVSNAQLVKNGFSSARVRKALQRTGLVPYNQVEAAVAILKNGYIWMREDKGACFLKLMVRLDKSTESPLWKQVSPGEINEFIENRMENYPEKYSDRMYFDNKLLSYMIRKSRNPIVQNTAQGER